MFNGKKLIGQKSPLKLKEIWGIRIRLQMAKSTRELALLNLFRKHSVTWVRSVA
jgi:hypothetical protein